jgi:hypothetical protein
MVKVVVDDRRGLVQETGTGNVRTTGPGLQLAGANPSSSLGEFKVKTAQFTSLPLTSSTAASTVWVEFSSSIDGNVAIPSGSMILGGTIQVLSGSGETAGGDRIEYVADETGAKWSASDVDLKLVTGHGVQWHWSQPLALQKGSAKVPRIYASAKPERGQYRLTVAYINASDNSNH